MKSALFFIRLYFKIISAVAPRFASKQAFNTFQKVRSKSFRDRELDFYKKAKYIKISNIPEDIYSYELGDINGKEVFLVHGWDSNPGSLSKIAYDLSNAGFRVLAMNLPGHGKATRSSTNLYEAKECFKKFILFYNPKDGFHCICHSFGSAVVSYGLSELTNKADRLVFLTSPNKISVIFEEFKQGVQLGNKAFELFCDMATKVVGEEIRELSVSNKLQNAQYNKLSIIHDQKDKVISIKNSKEIVKALPDTVLDIHSNIGHYRMLWNDEVVQLILNMIAESKN